MPDQRGGRRGVPRSRQHDVDVRAVGVDAAPTLADQAVEFAVHARSPASAPGELAVHDYDGAGALAATQPFERLLDAVEIGRVADHVSQGQATRRDERREAGKRVGDVGRAVVAALDRLLGEELDRRQRDLHAGRCEADDDRGTAGTQHLPGKPHRFRAPDHLEGVVDAAMDDRPDGAGRAASGHVDGVGGTTRERQLEPARRGRPRPRAMRPRAGPPRPPGARRHRSR